MDLRVSEVIWTLETEVGGHWMSRLQCFASEVDWWHLQGPTWSKILSSPKDPRVFSFQLIAFLCFKCNGNTWKEQCRAIHTDVIDNGVDSTCEYCSLVSGHKSFKLWDFTFPLVSALNVHGSAIKLTIINIQCYTFQIKLAYDISCRTWRFGGEHVGY